MQVRIVEAAGCEIERGMSCGWQLWQCSEMGEGTLEAMCWRASEGCATRFFKEQVRNKASLLRLGFEHMTNIYNISDDEQQISGDALRVESIYPSVQTVGKYAGKAVTVIKLAGPQIGTEATDSDWKYIEPKDIEQRIYDDRMPRHVVVTGGEPLEQYDQLKTLCRTLIGRLGLSAIHKVQIETSGIGHKVHYDDFKLPVWFTFKPAISFKRSPVTQNDVRQWDETIITIRDQSDFDRYEDYMGKICDIWLVPVGATATGICIKHVQKLSANGYDWRVSI